MTQKTNILAIVAIICTAFTLSACVVKKKKDDETGITASSCRLQNKAFDSARKACIEPNLAFCAERFMVKGGMGACRNPSGQSDCDTIGSALQKTLSWSNGKCQEVSSTAQTQPDSSIKISWQGKSSVQGAHQQFVTIGTATVTIGNNDEHQVSMMKKGGSTCDLRRVSIGGKSLKVEAKGSQSTCAGQILVINTKTGGYNVHNFSVTLN